MSRARLLAVVGLAALAGGGPIAAWAGAAKPSGFTRASAAPWRPDEVRSFLLGAEAAIRRQTAELLKAKRVRKESARSMGTCFGESPVYWFASRGAVNAILNPHVSGAAFQCYVSSYFGCTLGDQVAQVGVSFVGPARVPFHRSKVTILEQTRDRVVADVVEADAEVVDDDGVLYKQEPDELEPGEVFSPEYTESELATLTDKSRYTITRSTDGVWRISDRRPNWKWWECRVR